MKIVKKKNGRGNLPFALTNRKKLILISAISIFLLTVSVGSGIALRQKKFEEQVATLQTEAVQEMALKEVSTTKKIVEGDYSGSDIDTLRPGDLNVDATNLIQQYGVGMLEIPSIGMELPILEGITQANLSVGVGTVKPNQQLGKGTFALLGHYMTNRGLLFGGLKYVSIGDEIHITYYNESATYIVQESRIIHQSEGQYMYDEVDGSHWLTLLTCDGSRIGTDNRLMVRATLKE